MCMPPPTRSRTITLALAGLAALLLVGSVRFGYTYFDMRSGLARERVTPLCVIECDLSQPSEFQAQFRLDYPYGHGFKLLVDGPSRTPDRNEAEPWLDGLQGRVLTTRLTMSNEGEERVGLRSADLLPDWLGFASGPDSRALARLPAGDPGLYQLEISITRGASALAGTPHRLIVMNDVCGCELMAGFISLVIGLCLGALGLMALGGVGLRLRRPLVPRSTTEQPNAPSAAPAHT